MAHLLYARRPAWHAARGQEALVAADDGVVLAAGHNRLDETELADAAGQGFQPGVGHAARVEVVGAQVADGNVFYCDAASRLRCHVTLVPCSLVRGAKYLPLTQKIAFPWNGADMRLTGVVCTPHASFAGRRSTAARSITHWNSSFNDQRQPACWSPWRSNTPTCQRSSHTSRTVSEGTPVSDPTCAVGASDPSTACSAPSAAAASASSSVGYYVNLPPSLPCYNVSAWGRKGSTGNDGPGLQAEVPLPR